MFSVGISVLTYLANHACRSSRAVRGWGMRESDYELASRAAKLWPNREHEASAALGLLCRIGLHHWKRLDLTELMPDKTIVHCFWCSKVKVDGVVYDA